MAQPATNKIKINIKTIDADTFEIELKSNASIDELKTEIAKVKQLSPNFQRIIFRGRVLKSGKNLNDYSISNGSTLHLITKKSSSQPPNDINNPTSSSSSSNNNPNPNQNQNQPQTNINNPHQPNININTIPNGMHPGQFFMNNMMRAFQMNPNNRNTNQPQPQSQAQAQPQPMGPMGPHPMGAMGPMPNRNVFIRRMNPHTSSMVSSVIHQPNDNDNDNNDGIKEKIAIKSADVSNDGSTNTITWKIKLTKFKKWMDSKTKFQCYYSDEYLLNNGSIFRFFIYPNGINQVGYNNDIVLFIMLCKLPFNIRNLDIEFAQHCIETNVNFKFRKIFHYFNTSAGWPRGFLIKKKINELSNNIKYITFSCDLKIHSINGHDGGKWRNIDYINWKKQSSTSICKLIDNDPSSILYKWKLNKNSFINSAFKQYQSSKLIKFGNGFSFYCHLYPSGQSRNGYVQPYLHLGKLPKNVLKIDAHFIFYIKEINVGYAHCDIFNGKIGKGWPDMRLCKNDVNWDNLKSITLYLRINILNVSVSSNKWYKDILKVSDADADGNNNDNNDKKDQKNDDNDDNDDGDDGDKELKNWLTNIVGLPQYINNFLINEFHSLNDVIECIDNKNDLNEIDIKAFAHKTKIWKNIIKLKQTLNDNQNINDNTEPSEF